VLALETGTENLKLGLQQKDDKQKVATLNRVVTFSIRWRGGMCLMVFDPQRYLKVRFRAAKQGLSEIGQRETEEFFQTTKSNYYNYLQGLRDMAYYLGRLNEWENQLWVSLFLELYHCRSAEDLANLPDQPPQLA
jgi:hypothetical protein